MAKTALNIEGERIPANAVGALYQIESEDTTTEDFVKTIKDGAQQRQKELSEERN